MKKLFTLLAFVITITTFAQAPQGFNYQATVRNATGALVTNQNVYFKFNIMLNSQTSMPVFSETHMAPTDDLGQVNLVIGTGTATTGSFANINWGTGNYFLGIELNTGSGYVAMGTTQLLSVPYALYANSAGNAQAPTPDLATVLAVNNGANNLQIKNLADPTEAQDAATKNYVDTEIANIQISSQGKTSIYLTGNITDAQAAAKITAEFGPFTENIYIRNTTQLTTVDLSALETISNISIQNNSNLTNINLSNLSTIEDEFNFSGNAALSSLSFPSLLNCPGFYMDSSGLTSLNLPLLSHINMFRIYEYQANSTLVNLNLPAVQTIGGRFELEGLSSLTSLTFPMLHTLTGSILIQPNYNNVNLNITSLSFPALTSCSEIVTSFSNYNLLPGSISIGNYLPATINFSSLTTCNNILLSNVSSLNLSSLASCSDFQIYNSPSLTSLSFPSLTNNSNLSLGGNALTSNSVNSLLNKFLTVLPASGKNIYLEGQNPPAPPTGQGLIDKQTLITAGNSVTTDGFIPTITTTPVSAITSSSATSGGTITNDGGGTIQGSGIVWATTTNPTTANNFLYNGASNFTSNLTGLNPGTTYYVRAYATTSSGTAYGNELSFTTFVAAIMLPTLSTTAVTSSSTYAYSGGTITNDGGGIIAAKGLVWSTFTNPSIEINQGSSYDGTGMGGFQRTMWDLTPETTYYVRAYATNSAGTAYGNEISFVTQNTIPSVTIGSQIWSNTNLDVTSYRDGTPIPQVTDPTQWANLTTGAWCYYNNAPANGATYGKLYNWYAVAGIHDTDPSTPNKILAPIGWHVPTDTEWTTLTTFLGGESVAGGKMKSTGTSLWQSPNTAATNESGFTGLPAGFRYFNGTFLGIVINGKWWSSSENDTSNAWDRNLDYNNGNAYRNGSNKNIGFSVRLVKD